MTTTLITGGNKGLGLETARCLTRAGHTVYLGARDAARAEEAARSVGARPLQIDVTDDDSVRTAASRVGEESGHLDVLVNNAGIAGSASPAEEITGAEMLRVHDTNVFGAVRVLNAFLPLLRVSRAPVVVNVSSGLGSLAVASDPAKHAQTVPVWVATLPYSSSKAALNMVTAQYAHACPSIRINAVDPGHTATGLNGYTGHQSVTEGAGIIVRMATAITRLRGALYLVRVSGEVLGSRKASCQGPELTSMSLPKPSHFPVMRRPVGSTSIWTVP